MATISKEAVSARQRNSCDRGWLEEATQNMKCDSHSTSKISHCLVICLFFPNDLVMNHDGSPFGLLKIVAEFDVCHASSSTI